MKEDRYVVQSLVRAIDVLNVLADEGHSLGVSEISQRCGLSKSASFAILHTLLQAGLVADSGRGATRRYHLGLTLVHLGSLARASMVVPNVARPFLEGLAKELGHAVRLGFFTTNTVDVVERIDLPQALRIDLGMGHTELLHSTALGKAILSTWPTAEVMDVLGTDPLPARTGRTRVTSGGVLAELQLVRERGYAVDDEEDYIGIVCIGAPVTTDLSSPATWAISTTMLKAAVSREVQQRTGSAVAACAAAISDALAGRHRRTFHSSR